MDFQSAMETFAEAWVAANAGAAQVSILISSLDCQIHFLLRKKNNLKFICKTFSNTVDCFWDRIPLGSLINSKSIELWERNEKKTQSEWNELILNR